LLQSPHGLLRPPHRADDFLGKRVVTDDGQVQLGSPVLLAQGAKLSADFERERQNARRLKLIGRRAVGTHNSWTHNVDLFTQGGTNHLHLHPDDASRLGLVDGALADVTTDTGQVRVPVKLHPDLMPGTVALPHGWGHQHATGLSVASRTRGVNVNLLAADGPERIERVSGMAHLTGMLVEVRPAAGPQDPSSWSGLPPDAVPGGGSAMPGAT
jgi:anaerobic selenocysteine-containing dehydrogenase